MELYPSGFYFNIMEVLKIKDWIKTRRKQIAIAEDIGTKDCVIEFFYLPVGIKDIGDLYKSDSYKKFVKKHYEDYHKKNTATKSFPTKLFSGELGIIMSPTYGGKCAPPTSMIEYLKTVQ